MPTIVFRFQFVSIQVIQLQSHQQTYHYYTAHNVSEPADATGHVFRFATPPSQGRMPTIVFRFQFVCIQVIELQSHQQIYHYYTANNVSGPAVATGHVFRFTTPPSQGRMPTIVFRFQFVCIQVIELQSHQQIYHYYTANNVSGPAVATGHVFRFTTPPSQGRMPTIVFRFQFVCIQVIELQSHQQIYHYYTANNVSGPAVATGHVFRFTTPPSQGRMPTIVFPVPVCLYSGD